MYVELKLKRQTSASFEVYSMMEKILTNYQVSKVISKRIMKGYFTMELLKNKKAFLFEQEHKSDA